VQSVLDTRCLSQDDPRKGHKLDAFMSEDGKPDSNGRSSAPAWIIVADKSKEVGEGYVDVFYFYLYVSPKTTHA
jgi:hypothetical protein